MSEHRELFKEITAVFLATAVGLFLLVVAATAGVAVVVLAAKAFGA